jgi:multicomponent Na+:H+ antiporter subunit G
MLGALAPWLADALVLLGALVMTIGVAGVIRMPDVFTKIHASSKSVVFGVCSFLLAAFITGDNEIRARVVLIGMLLVLTTPVAAHEIARAAVRERDAVRR